MTWKKDSGYGRLQTEKINLNGSGQIFVVGGVASRKGMLQELFDVDNAGTVRYHSTLDGAINACTADAGDTIYLMPNHTETVSAASGITVDVDGIKIIGLGEGANRPQITFDTATTASMVISADNVLIDNIIGVAGIDSLVNPFNVTGDNVKLNIEWRDGSASVEAVRAILATGSDNSTFNIIYRGFINGNAVANAIRLVECKSVDINIWTYGLCSTGWVEMVTTASSNVKVKGSFYTDGINDLSRNVVDTVTGSTWSVEGFDMGVSQVFTGGSGTAVSSQDLSVVTSQITANGTAIAGSNGFADSLLGTFVSRNAADIFDGTTTSLFTISGGNVLITHIELEVSGAAVDNTTSNVKLQVNPTTGSTVDICANLDVDSDEEGSLYSITGTFTDALQGGSAGAVASMAKTGVIAAPGTLDIVSSADAGTGGALVAARIWYRVLESGASIVST